ncbi:MULTISPECIES: THUMP domain-containing class I SAM-dependent RNA methyltransferase [unclassified Prochlorococcus]|uniref:THUMP domain-containing class I SAM-dependent RNA methyltransferase n=1 Tax=unclassified Prochlorococcus TaxID=2627481 RepID=UPI000533BB50|nr:MULTISPECIES: class I SAM-dependent RNA methyltransferase [unclassified Prochlorococcus]KGG16889.1 putative RNA methylase family UPF0020 [Prochlorococcus sp. MIT 0602]KGG18136.1 putative RNA methylase family UPF0020 [Prochlorococcus sp. MIT 0603]
MNLLAVLPQGLEEAGSVELKNLGATSVSSSRGSVRCKVDLACFYRLHLQARLPFRFLREISQFPCINQESLYTGVQNAFDWSKWLKPSTSFRVDVTGKTGDLNHSHFTALQVKNALVDLQRSIWGKRSDINLHCPALCIHLHLFSGYGILSLDTSATSLHRRGYRAAMGIAPLKENIAAGLIKLSNWNDSLTLLDPFCGSATFLLEAASISRGIASGLNREFLFQTWPDFDKSLWINERSIAKTLFLPQKKLPRIVGYEENLQIANQAKDNILSAGLNKDIEIISADFTKIRFPQLPGVIVCNPPYGKRIGKFNDLKTLYQEFGQFLKEYASGWDLWLLNGNAKLSNFLGMKCSRRFPVSNGGIDCRWLHYKIH